MKRKILTGLAALSLLVCVVSTQGCYDVGGYPGGYGYGGGYPSYAYGPAYGWGHPYYGGGGWGHGGREFAGGHGGWGHGGGHDFAHSGHAESHHRG